MMTDIESSPWIPHIIDGGCKSCLLDTRFMGTESIRLSMYGLESVNILGIPFDVYMNEYVLLRRGKELREVHWEKPESDLDTFNMMLASLGYEKLQNPDDTIVVTWNEHAIERPRIMPRRVFGFTPINAFTHCEGMYGEFTRLVFTRGNNASMSWSL